MGRGIAQIAAAAGIEVRLNDARKGAAEEARGFIAKMLERQVEKGLAADARAIERVRIADSADLAPCDLVVEAIVEDFAAKQRLFADLEQIVRRRYGAGDQHLVALGQRDRGGLQKARAGGGLAFLQPGAADEAGRGDARPAHRRARGRSAAGARPAHGPSSGARHRFAGLSGQPRRARLRHRGAAHPRRGRREPGRDRPHPARGGRLSHGAVRALRPRRHRRHACGDGIDLAAVLRRAALPAAAADPALRRRRPARPQERRRLLPLRRRPPAGPRGAAGARRAAPPDLDRRRRRGGPARTAGADRRGGLCDRRSEGAGGGIDLRGHAARRRCDPRRAGAAARCQAHRRDRSAARLFRPPDPDEHAGHASGRRSMACTRRSRRAGR